MSRVADLVASRPAPPSFDIVRAAYAELLVTNLEASEHFYVDLLGLIVSERTDSAIHLRGWEERLHYSLILRKATSPAVRRLAFRVRSHDDLGALAAAFEKRGCAVKHSPSEDSGRGDAVQVWDPFGFPLEFFHEMRQDATQLQRFDLQRGAPVMRLDHFNLHTSRIEATFAFWLDLGFKCTEYISTDGDPEQLTGAWLARRSSVHDVALTVGSGPRLHHIGLAVPEPGAVLRACDQLAAAGWASAIERGPGRHGVSNAFFVYLRDPDGHRIELYTCDYYTGDPDHQPIRWSAADPSCRSFWGTRAPDSWYSESSVVLDPEEHETDTVDAQVDEREAWTEVLA